MDFDSVYTCLHSVETFWNLLISQQFAAVFLVNCSQSHGVKPTLTHCAWSKQRRMKASGVERCLSLIFSLETCGICGTEAHGVPRIISPYRSEKVASQITNNLQHPKSTGIWCINVHHENHGSFMLKTLLLPAPMVQCLRCCTEPSADCNLLAPGFPCANSIEMARSVATGCHRMPPGHSPRFFQSKIL